MVSECRKLLIGATATMKLVNVKIVMSCEFDNVIPSRCLIKLDLSGKLPLLVVAVIFTWRYDQCVPLYSFNPKQLKGPFLYRRALPAGGGGVWTNFADGWTTREHYIHAVYYINSHHGACIWPNTFFTYLPPLCFSMFLFNRHWKIHIK